MIIVVDSASSGLCLNPGQVYCVAFLGQAMYSLHPGIRIGSSEFNAGHVGTLTCIPSRRKKKYLLAC